MKQPYQLLPPLRSEEYAALEADIKERGVLIAVEYDEDENVLDGHHRSEIANRLGIKFKKIVRHFKSEQAKQEHVIKVNLARRHLDPLRWGQAFKKLLEVRGIKSGQNSSATKRHSQSATVADVASEVGVPERTARHRLALAKTYDSLPKLVRDEIDQGKKTVPQARNSVRKAKQAEQLKVKAESLNGHQPIWTLIHQDVLTGLQSVIDHHSPARLIFADPPYNIGVDYGEGTDADQLPDQEYMTWVQRWIATSKLTLTNDGSLWVLIGDEYAAEYAIALKASGFHIRSWIKWYETFGVNCSNRFNRTSRHLFYCVLDPKRFVFNHDAVTRPSDRQTKYNDKRAATGGKLLDDVWTDIPRLTGTCDERIASFPTQLPIALVQRVVECASEPGDLVVDPFNGSGTTGVACLRAKPKRKYIGIDSSEKFIDLAEKRLRSEAAL